MLPTKTKTLIIFSLLCLSSISKGQSASGTDIFLANLKQVNGVLHLSNHRNITNREGYDNQPYFLPDGDRLFYTSVINEGGNSQTDILLYSVKKGSVANISRSPESEYSPTPIGNGATYSIIRVAADGKQKLWSYSVNGEQKRELLKDVEPVGYHAWVDKENVVLFVLGDPHRFELANIVSGNSQVFDKDIGASLFTIPSSNLMSYSRNINQESEQAPLWQLTQFDPLTKQSKGLINLPEGAYYYAWSADGKALAAQKTKLMQWTYRPDGTEVNWLEFADVSEHCPKGVTRMAVNQQNSLLAYVCDR